MFHIGGLNSINKHNLEQYFVTAKVYSLMLKIFLNLIKLFLTISTLQSLIGLQQSSCLLSCLNRREIPRISFSNNYPNQFITCLNKSTLFKLLMVIFHQRYSLLILSLIFHLCRLLYLLFH